MGDPQDRDALEDDEVFPSRAAEDIDHVWGERPDEDDDERLLREKPPHW